jgi:DNA-3-methyladenine glycosylase
VSAARDGGTGRGGAARDAAIASSELAPLPRAFFEREVLVVARELLGRLIVRRAGGEVLVARIVEVEAYGGQDCDPSAHSFRGQTPRCAVMFGPAGIAYVYTTHQGRCCLNVSAVGDARGKAVLLRAAEPLSGLEAMCAARLDGLADGPTRTRLLAGRAPHELLSGPARLCTALHIDRALNGVDLCNAGGELWLADGEPASRVAWTARVGLNPKSASFGWHWRAVAADSRAVSAPRNVDAAARGPTPRQAGVMPPSNEKRRIGIVPQSAQRRAIAALRPASRRAGKPRSL